MTKKQNKLLYQNFNKVWNKEKLWRGITPPISHWYDSCCRGGSQTPDNHCRVRGCSQQYQGEASASRHPEIPGTKGQDIPEATISTKEKYQPQSRQVWLMHNLPWKPTRSPCLPCQGLELSVPKIEYNLFRKPVLPGDFLLSASPITPVLKPWNDLSCVPLPQPNAQSIT